MKIREITFWIFIFLSVSCTNEIPKCSIICDNENVTAENIIAVSNCDRFESVNVENPENVSNKKSNSGKHSTELNKQHPYAMTYEVKNVIPGEQYKISVWRHDSNPNGCLVASASNTDDLYFVQHNSSGRKKDEWEELIFEFIIPEVLRGQNIKIYCMTINDSLPVYFDDMCIEYVTVSANGTANVQSLFTDVRDGKAYKTVQIGNQVWISENMNYRLNDSCFCYNHEKENCKQYGRLYNFQDACKVCPDGWRLPSDKDWKLLEATLGMSADDCNKYGNRGNYETFYLLESGSAGFNSKAGGAFNDGFYDLNKSAFYWSSTPADDSTFYCREISHRTDIGRFKDNPQMKFSVRCIKNKR